MIIINEITIFAQIPLKRDALARDENEELIHDEDKFIQRGMKRLEEIIEAHDVYGYSYEDKDAHSMFIFMNGHLQDIIVKETIDIIKSFSSLSSKPFIVECFIEGEYKYHVLFDEHSSSMEEAKILDHLVQMRDNVTPNLLKLEELPVKFAPELKKLNTAINKFFDHVEVVKILPTCDIVEAIDEMQQEIQNG